MNAFALSVALCAFLIGTLFGSFLNVCISRLPKHRSIVAPRSQCPQCHAPIRWYDNIPLLSFVWLGGKCRDCRTKIPSRYPLVELTMGLWFAFVTWRAELLIPQVFSLETTQRIYAAYPPSFAWEHTALLAILGFLLIGLLAMDWETHRLPDAFTLPGTAIGFLFCCVQAYLLPVGVGDVHLTGKNPITSAGSTADAGNVVLTGAEAMVLSRLGAIFAAAGLILLVRWLYKKIRHQEGLGLGDAKLMALLAAFLGLWPAMLALFVGIFLCAVYAVTLLARRRASGSTPLPLGAFLCLGGLFAAILGEPLISWYRMLL